MCIRSYVHLTFGVAVHGKDVAGEGKVKHVGEERVEKRHVLVELGQSGYVGQVSWVQRCSPPRQWLSREAYMHPRTL